MLKTKKPAQTETQRSSDALIALVRLLARQAAREALAEAATCAGPRQVTVSEDAK